MSEEFINNVSANVDEVLVDIGSNDSNWILQFRLRADDIIRYGTFVDHWEE